MKKTLKGEDARRFLKNVEPEWKAFWFHMGAVAKNLGEFEAAMRKSSEQMFKYHSTAAKNDFSTWVKEVIGDDALADALKASRSAKDAADKVGKRIMELQKAAKKFAEVAAKEAKRGAGKK